MPDPRIGQRIRAARLEAGLSLSELCGSRISLPHLSLIEQGKRGIAGDRLLYLADRLGKRLGHFLTGDVEPRLFESLIREGERIARSGAHARAEALFHDLVDHVPAGHDGFRARCHLWLGITHVRLRRYGPARSHLAEGKRLAEATADPHLIAQAHNSFGVYYLERNEYQLGLAELEAAEGLLRGGGRARPDLLSMVLLNLGHALRAVGRLREARARLEEAGRAAARLDDRLLRGVIARVAASVLMDMRAYGEAQAQLETALDYFTGTERLDMVAFVENGLGMLCLQTGDPEAALPHLQRAVNLWTRLGDDRYLGRNLTEVGRAYLMLGDGERALGHLDEAIRRATTVDDDTEAACAEVLRAEILTGRGHLDEAEAALASAIPVLERREQCRDLIHAYTVLGRVLQAQGRIDQASESLARAVELAGVRTPGT